MANLQHQFYAGFGAAVLALIVTGVVAAHEIGVMREADAWTDHTHEVRTHLAALERAVLDAQSQKRAFALDGDERFASGFEAARAAADNEIRRVRALTVDNPARQAQLDVAEQRVARRMAHLAEGVALRRAHPDDPSVQARHVADSVEQQARLTEALAVMDADEERLLGVRADDEERSARRTMWALGVAPVLALVALILAALRVRRDLAARRAGDERLRELAAGLERNNDALRLTGEMIGMLSACEDVREARPVLSAFLARLLPEASGGLFVMNASRNLIESVATWGGFDESAFGPAECWALRRGHAHASARGDVELACAHAADAASGAATLCLPMAARGEAIGVLVLARSCGIDQADPLLIRIGQELSLALANLRLRASLRHLSVRDPLTGLFNRRYLEETLEREVRRAERGGQPLAVVVADLDHFKLLNDTQGHQAGDEALQAVAHVLASSMRGEDVACRYGGEEFILVMPGCSLDAAAARADQIRAKIRALDVHHKNRRIGPLTASFGVAAVPEHGATGDVLIRHADLALYRAKREGRDRLERAATSGASMSLAPAPLAVA